MKMLRKPKRLKRGDTVATVSLSWGGAGDKDIYWRYLQGKKRLEEEFGLTVIEMPNTLAGTDFLDQHPEKRAEDLMMAFKNPEIKAIFSCIGGDDSIRLLPYIDLKVIEEHPKIFIGYSDTTVAHLMCYQAGLTSFYGPCLLAEFAENVTMHDYTKEWVKQVLFKESESCELLPPAEWTSEYLPWIEENKDIKRSMRRNTSFHWLQGSSVRRGPLFGGCIEVLEFAKETKLWPSISDFEGAILFFETSEETPHPTLLKYWLRNYGSQGILQQINGILFGKPYDEKYLDEYETVILRVIREELGLIDLPIITNLSFGHTAPMMVLPYGALVEIDCESQKIRLLEVGIEN